MGTKNNGKTEVVWHISFLMLASAVWILLPIISMIFCSEISLYFVWPISVFMGANILMIDSASLYYWLAIVVVGVVAQVFFARRILRELARAGWRGAYFWDFVLITGLLGAWVWESVLEMYLFA